MKLLRTFIYIALLINRHSCIPRISTESGDIVDDNTTHAHITQTVSASPTTSSGNSDSYYVQDFVSIDKDTLLCLYPGSDQRLDSCLTPTGSICNGMKTAKLYEKEIVLCSCQPQCLLSEDCCYDFMDVCIRNSENPPTLDDLWPSSYCLSRPDMYDIVIIHRCPREWSDDEFRKKCEKTNDTSVLDLTPVFTLSDHDVYQNIYCAVCNGIDPSAVQFLPLQWSCDIPRRTKAEIWHILRQHNISSVIATVQKIPDCKLTVGVPNDVQEKLPICVNYIKECPSDFGDLNLVHRCQNFTANVQVGSATSIRFALRFYKNIHCALCNEPQVNLSEIVCGIPADYTGFKRLPSFNVLFDFTAQGFQRVFAYGDYFTEQWNCDHDEMFDIVLEKCVKKIRYQPSEFENRASIVNTRSMSRDMISWYILLTFHISFPSQNVRPALTEFERNVTQFIRRSLSLNKTISISESELQYFSAHHATITLKVDVESTSIVFTEEILPSACMRTWADSESEVSMIGAEIQSVTFELPNGNCSNMTDRVTLKGSIFEYNNETLNEDEVANITWHPVFTFSHFMSKSCFYKRESSNLQNIAIEMVMCISKSDEDDETPFTCANGVILKLAADDFEITEGILVVDSSFYPEDQFVLSDDQSYAYICHINQKVASFWNTSSKTKLKQFLTLIGCILSIVCLVVSIITICAFKQMRTRPGKIILNFAIALVTAQLLFITVMDVVHIPWLCKITAIFSHYFWLSAFCWMSVMATDIIYMRTQLTGHISGDGKVFVYYCLYAWLLPFLFVGICVIMDNFAPTDFQIGYSEGPVCWIGRLTSLVVTFLVPVGLILLYNTICFLYTIWSIFTSESKMKHHRQKSYTTKHVIFSIKMSTVMGLTWIIGFLDGFLQSGVLDYIFIVANTLQGVFIFLAFLMRLRTVGLYYNACCRKVKENQTVCDMHHFTDKSTI